MKQKCITPNCRGNLIITRTGEGRAETPFVVSTDANGNPILQTMVTRTYNCRVCGVRYTMCEKEEKPVIMRIDYGETNKYFSPAKFKESIMRVISDDKQKSVIARTINEQWIVKAYEEADAKDYLYSAQELVDFTFDKLSEMASIESAIRYLFKAGTNYIKENDKYKEILKEYI